MRFILVALLSLLLGITAACDRDDQSREASAKVTGGPHYYHSFDGKYHPFTPVDEIPAGQPKPNDAYYAAYFDDQGLLVRLEKYLHGAIWETYEYSYDAQGKLIDGRHLDAQTGQSHPLTPDREVPGDSQSQ